jgi:asparagine synthase (glutamine-hydrolysing)
LTVCGIAGVVSLREDLPPPEVDDLTAMVGALRHRGPDEFGLFRDRRAGLGHARLSIIDLAAGQQPMCNEDRSLWITYNGEIFNYLELRDELSASGHRFRTQSDTEVILHAWQEWGERCFERFNGQFAIGLWDSRREVLVLARDRFGERPMYLCEHGGRLWFASEVKSIFAGAPGVSRSLDPVGLAETFTFWTVAPPQSVFAGIRELRPGHFAIVGRQGTREAPFWTPRYPENGDGTFPGTVAEAADRVRGLLREAVSLRILRAEVPVGCYLSGGLDSSLIAAMGREVKGDRFSTFSIRFEEAEFDETVFQRAVAARIESDHREIVVSRRDIAESFPAVVWHAERPLLRTAPAPLFLLSSLVRSEGIKVVLTGEGADEVFAGYDIFREGKVRRFWGRQPASTMRPRLLDRLYPYLSRSPVAQQALAREFFGRDRDRWGAPGFSHQIRWRSAAALQRLFRPEMREQAAAVNVVARLLGGLPPEFEKWSFLAQDQHIEIQTLLSGYLLSSQGDRMLMAHSVEGRFPFLDAHVVEFANSLTPSAKLRGLDEKHVLKRAASGLVPDEILGRKKQPYRAPDASCFGGPEAPEWVAELMEEACVRDAGVFDPDAVSRLWRKAQSSKSPSFSNADNMAIVGVLSTGLLHEQFVHRSPQRCSPGHFRTFVDLAVPGAVGHVARAQKGLSP